MTRTMGVWSAALLSWAVAQDRVAAQQTADRQVAPPAVEASPFSLGGYIEAFYQWNFNDPSNGVTNYRGFDNRHDSFTLSNVALDAAFDDGQLIGKLTLQVGHTPSTYYLSEPRVAGASGGSASDGSLWKYVQQAYGGARFAALHDVAITAGVFLSPIGPESMAVHDNWNWSRSHLFFGLPFYHTGVRAALPLDDTWTLTVALLNGWNSVVDNNRAKSLLAQVTMTRANLVWSALYFGGVERPRAAPEGRALRHLFDSHLTWHATSWLSLLAHANVGFEPNAFGTSRWIAGALAGRVQVMDCVFVAARGDLFREHVPSDASGRASPIFWPVDWVSSGTLTLDYRPHARISFRLEYRHDQAARAMFFGEHVSGDGVDIPFAPNRKAQDTLTIGTTAWF